MYHETDAAGGFRVKLVSGGGQHTICQYFKYLVNQEHTTGWGDPRKE
jgi:hypothetical protein